MAYEIKIRSKSDHKGIFLYEALQKAPLNK